MTRSRKLVLLAVVAFFAIWLGSNLGRLLGQQDGTIRFVLGALFALLILLRPKPNRLGAVRLQFVSGAGGRLAAGVSALGALLGVAGLIFNVSQFEWLGIMLLLYGCLRWALPVTFSRDILLALFLLYWVHPLPSQVFGKLQLGMQILSMKGAEWMLHGLNFRVWADNLMIFTGTRIFGVPEICSGMRTATTVLLLTLGISLLYRFRIIETVLFLLLGLFQVLILNMFRITFMVWWGSNLEPDWAVEFLHETLLIFLLVSLAMIQGEATWWRLYKIRRKDLKDGIASGEYETPDFGTKLPSFWRHASRWGWLVSLVFIGLLVTTAAVYKSRPAHRMAMRVAVIDGLLQTNPEAAERVVAQCLARDPENPDLKLKKARLLLLRQDAQAVIDVLDSIEGESSFQATIYRSWALMTLGSLDEAAVLLHGLPAATRQWPAVAMLRAELAARKDDVRTVIECLPTAAHSNVDIQRVRALFPYLAARQQWRAIAEADGDAPYYQFPIALIAIHAHLVMHDVPTAGNALRRVLHVWPRDHRLLPSLYRMAVAQPYAEWDSVFARILEANLAHLDPDRLASYIDFGFRMGRADLAWKAYRQLEQVDPTDPALYLSPVQFASRWFLVRKALLGAPGGVEVDRHVDLKPLLRRCRTVEGFSGLLETIPLAGILLESDFETLRDDYVQKAWAELERREATGALAKRLELTWPLVLALRGELDAAHRKLDALAKQYPDRKVDILEQRANLYMQQTRWQELYEVVSVLRAEQPAVDFRTELMMINAQMNLNMAVCAMDLANQAALRFPEAPQISASIAAIWDVFGFKDQALFVLQRADIEREYLGVVQLLYDTGRFQAADRMAASLNAQRARPRPGFKQRLNVPPAELTVEAWPGLTRSAVEMDKLALQAEREAASAVSPFVRDRALLTARWYRQRGEGSVSDMDTWLAVARTPLEEVALLRRLAVLLSVQGEKARAVSVVKRALAIMPRSPILWRMLLSLTTGDPTVVDAARVQCPDDPEIWLASFVVRQQRDGSGDWAQAEIAEAIRKNRYCEQALVRAGDFCLRFGMLDAAVLAAKHTESRTEGYLPARVLAIKCAVRGNNSRWATASALAGAAEAEDPTPFYRTVVAVKASQQQQDADMVTALEYLSEKFPEEALWSEYLGNVYFDRGDPKRALTVLMPVVGSQFGDTRVRSLLVAAESARLQNQLGKAVDILEAAYAAYPERVSVLNNLIYVLAQRQETLPRARNLLPALLALDNASHATLDTAAVVYLHAGELEAARHYLDRALNVLTGTEYAAHEVLLHEAELHFAAQDFIKAKDRIEALRRVPGMSPLVERRSREILEAVEEAQ